MKKYIKPILKGAAIGLAIGTIYGLGLLKGMQMDKLPSCMDNVLNNSQIIPDAEQYYGHRVDREHLYGYIGMEVMMCQLDRGSR